MLSVADNNGSAEVGGAEHEGDERLEVRGDGDRQNVPNHFYSVHHHRYHHRPAVGAAHNRHVIQKRRSAAERSEVDEDRAEARRRGAGGDGGEEKTAAGAPRVRRSFTTTLPRSDARDRIPRCTDVRRHLSGDLHRDSKQPTAKTLCCLRSFLRRLRSNLIM